MPARILVCDDESHISRAVSMRLARAGFDVETAADGEAGWTAILRQIPAVVVTDCQMPRLDGIELAQRIRARAETRHVPIILLTAKGYEIDTAQLAGKLHPFVVVPKPFSPRELLDTVLEMQSLEALAYSAGDCNGQASHSL